MTASFSDDPAIPGRRIWQQGTGAGALRSVVAVMAAIAGIGFSAIGISIFVDGKAFFIPALEQLVGIFIVSKAWEMWRDAQGKDGGCIAIQDGALMLDLPSYRSLTVRSPALNVEIPLKDVQAVETRLENLKTLITANMQRAYRLTLRTQPAIFLFEERRLNTELAGESMREVAVEIAARAGVPFDDLGMVDVQAGVFGVFFKSVPSWSSAPLTQEQQKSRWATAHRTAVLVAALSLAYVVVRLLLR